jgi:hypothetical protein
MSKSEYVLLTVIVVIVVLSIPFILLGAAYKLASNGFGAGILLWEEFVE